jgi:glycosyltransferase involved in cell wall biosynthesis
LRRRRAASSRGRNPRSILRVCIVYDRLYPWSIGGAERWYRLLAEHLAAAGHHVTYLTSRQWPAGEEPRVPGVRVLAVGAQGALYHRERRRVLPVIRFAFALWRHLLRHGANYDVVHASTLSAWATLAAASLARPRGYRLVLDWWEVWTWAYWRNYLGPIAGSAGWLLQRLCAALPYQPLAYSELHANRLRALRRWPWQIRAQLVRGRCPDDACPGAGRSYFSVPILLKKLSSIVSSRGTRYLGSGARRFAAPRCLAARGMPRESGRTQRARRDDEMIPVIRGLLPQSLPMQAPLPAGLMVVYVGRHIPEKQIEAIIPALARARERLPALQAVLVGDGPARQTVLSATRTLALEEAISLPGFVAEEQLEATLERALCLILFSQREGYGLVVAEAAALGVPSIVLRHPDSAAAELIVEGVNGTTCGSTNPEEIASAMLRIHDAGYDLRLSTLRWFQTNSGTLTIAGSLPRILAAYRGDS